MSALHTFTAGLLGHKAAEGSELKVLTTPSFSSGVGQEASSWSVSEVGYHSRTPKSSHCAQVVGTWLANLQFSAGHEDLSARLRFESGPIGRRLSCIYKFGSGESCRHLRKAVRH